MRPIDADLIIELMEELNRDSRDKNINPRLSLHEVDLIIMREDIIEMMKEAPTIDAAPVVRGKWVTKDYTRAGYARLDIVCSNCNSVIDTLKYTSYCQNCGANMKEV